MWRAKKGSTCRAFLADAMQVLRAADHKRMAWKNGGGETVEIIVSPPQASMDSFDWRISMATIMQDGAFSSFAGVDRTLTVLSGDGIELTMADRPVVILSPASSPYAFPADVGCSARLLGSTVSDLNVMTARDSLTHQVRPIDGPTRQAVAPGSVVVVVSTGVTRLATPDHQVELGHLDAVVFEGVAEADFIEIAPEGRGFLILIDRLHPDRHVTPHPELQSGPGAQP